MLLNLWAEMHVLSASRCWRNARVGDPSCSLQHTKFHGKVSADAREEVGFVVVPHLVNGETMTSAQAMPSTRDQGPHIDVSTPGIPCRDAQTKDKETVILRVLRVLT